MSDLSPRGRRIFAALLASGVALGATASLTLAANAEPQPESGELKASTDTLGGHDLDLLAEAEAAGKDAVTLIIATDEAKAGDVAAQVEALGGTVANQVDEVGYVLASVPTDQVTKTAKLPGIQAIDLNETIALPDPRPDGAQDRHHNTPPAPSTGPGPQTPAANPFMPTHEIGSVEFKQEHPTWDGRGVTIGILDSGVDLDHASLASTSTGERKIVDWVTATDPVFDGDATWRVMLTSVNGPSFTVAGSVWTAPAGQFKFNRFNEAITGGGDVAGDVNRDGDTTDLFGVLYDPATNDIWVDVNQNFNFTDDALMRPYKEKFDVGHFGMDNPATAVVEKVPFVVEYREDVDVTPAGLPGVADFVNIGISQAAHGSHVAGITAANDMLGNANLDGQAPGAKIVSSRACSWGGGCTAAALTDGMMDLVVNRGVDVVNMSIGGLPALNDGNNARAQLYDRLIDIHGVQIFISAGNSGPGVNTIGDPSVASKVVSVAATVSKDTWFHNYGSVVKTNQAMMPFSSRGPREDGGFKPNVSAPGAAISTVPAFLPGAPVAQAGYGLPPGYAMLQGTSMASPQAAGATALLLSAAKAEGKTVTPAQLRRAIYTSAEFRDGIPAYAQGNGWFDVEDAWKALNKGADAHTYTVSAPVCTPISDFLATPDSGTGIYNRCGADEGGHKAGQSKTYRIQITRTSGPDKGSTHEISWVGDDRAFKSLRNVVLPLNKPVNVSVQVKPGAGASSAIMRIDDPATRVTDFETMNTVVVAETPTAPDYSKTFSGSVQRNAPTSYFVDVPEGATALQVNLSGIAAGSQVRWIAINPYGVPVDSTTTTMCYPNFSDETLCNPLSRAYANPLPGIWEIEVEARRTSPVLDNPYTVSARVQGVKVEPSIVQLPSVQAGVPSPVSWTLTNQFGPVNVTGRGGSLGSALLQRPTIADQATQTFQVEVPAGASRLDVVIGNPSDLGADLDLFVRRNGVLVGQAADGDSEEAVSIVNPAAGTYVVEIDGFSVPAGTTAYDYRDVFFSSSLGTVDVTPTPVALGEGGTATVTGSVVANAAPAAGRALFGEMSVVTDQGAVVGRGSVSIGSVG